MISPSSFITPTLALAERKDCPRGYGFYNCYSFYDCCDVDPCDYEYGHASDPCYVAGGHPLQETTTITTTTTTKHTQATTLADFTTGDPETDTETETSTTDDPETSSSSSSTKTDASTTTTADGTTLSTSVISTSDAPNSATRTLPAPLPTISSPTEDSSLPNGTIAGISVVSAVGAILILTSFFWFARRRRMSKRMSSMRGTSPTPMDSPSLGFDFGFGTTGGGSSPASDTHAQCSELPTPSGAQAEKKQPPAEPAPTHAELDSSEMPRPIPNIQRTSSTPVPDNTPTTQQQQQQQQPPRYSTGSGALADYNRHLHPPLLTPGFRGGSVVQNSRDSANFPWIQPRATLNATEDERKNNQYANSWSSGP
ncbi:hypothetical protein F5Y08DRAFT_194129 [Xylaria arbuscula]|nr:hypothetical protein F5Y08DRAFT_194129 [Xylaria arbuscula]